LDGLDRSRPLLRLELFEIFGSVESMTMATLVSQKLRANGQKPQLSYLLSGLRPPRTPRPPTRMAVQPSVPIQLAHSRILGAAVTGT